ncbi:aminopeptidase N [Rugamonas sp. CCM 8940]|uniref:aminopeptidase N n=1 Tax=Rugamonas sp. CCM 8940 TaxID=2765359 RepID=UPI0018F4E7CF|nr:aminopeptidase N [Rugamonas sp. CCM 8940]MBJ7312754.1 aminopeptidase N [Rugamonas sp. CCM 8940]
MHTITPRLSAIAGAALLVASTGQAWATAPAAATTVAAATTAAPTARADNRYLAQVDAEARAARLSKVDYALQFTLSGEESFSGSSTVGFDLSDASTPLTLDLDQASIGSLQVNGKSVTPQYNGSFITLAPQDLRLGRNSVVVVYQRRHSSNGEGLHRMVDPADGRVYTYSHFEPAAAHQMFALFDQPDLKATYQLSVTAPADWQVVSAMRERAVETVAGGKRWDFPATPRLSAYNFSLHAGPYKVWEDRSGKYPLRLMARQSVAGQVAPADWFKYTNGGLAFFEKYFGLPYPFEKYDQLLVPDFLYGAMENAGAITFAEKRFLFKESMTAAQKQNLASVILHEMAHQWFGDLVTMKWWNGLWLNESFAAFMATLATAESTEFSNAWQSFYSGGKQAAYTQDQQVTTHAIETPVPSTANAFDNIDAITYSKGASTLKQLRHLLGEEVFRQGVHNYLAKYSWQNAKLDDFIGSLGQAAGRDLSGWTQDWLYQAGVNTVTAQYRCAGGKVSEFALRQEGASAALPTLREQRVQIGLFNLRKGTGQLVLERQQALTYSGALTQVPQLVGEDCPDLVYPNYADWGYVQVRLDERSFRTAQASLGKVADPLLRAMLWQSLWDGVRAGQLPLQAFLRAVRDNAPAERDYTLLGDIVGKTRQAKAYLDQIAPGSAWQRDSSVALERMALAGARAAKGDVNFQRRWFGLYLDIASSPAALARLAGVLDGKDVPAGLPVGQDLRWDIVARLNRYDVAGSAALIDAELARDPSDAGQAAALAARVGRPDAKAKQEWLAQIVDLDSKLPFSRRRVMMENLYPAEQGVLNEATAAERLALLLDKDKAAGPIFMRSYGGHLIPANCTPASVERLARSIATAAELSAGSRRALLVAQQEDARCVAIQRAMKLPPRRAGRTAGAPLGATVRRPAAIRL